MALLFLCFVLAAITYFWYDILALPNLPLKYIMYSSKESYLFILVLIGSVSAVLGYLNRR